MSELTTDAKNASFRAVTETKTGMSIDEIRATPLDELRTRFERQSGKPMRVKGALSRDQLNAQIDELLRTS